MIFLECNTDEFLIKSLGFSKKQISHERCKAEVVKKVIKQKKAIGIIDQDPGSKPPGYLETFTNSKTNGNIKLLIQSGSQKKKIIEISPYLEHWLLNRAKSNKIDPADFNLPDDPKKLHKIPRIETKQQFKEFLSTLITSSDSELQTLKEWINQALK